MNSKALLIKDSGKYPGQAGPILTAPSGRQFYRHNSGIGIVMIYTEQGVEKRMLVPDAVNRANALAWDSNSSCIDTSLPNFTAIPSGSRGYFVGDPSNTTGCKAVTDARLDALFGKNGDTGTAKGNTDVIVASRASTAAARHCRSKTIDGQPCDLPIIQQLVRIYCDADFIDSLDPTAAANPSLKLSGWPFYSRYAWSSKEFGIRYAWIVTDPGYCLATFDKTFAFGVVPVLEL